jgi:hypothetical protein
VLAVSPAVSPGLPAAQPKELAQVEKPLAVLERLPGQLQNLLRLLIRRSSPVPSQASPFPPVPSREHSGLESARRSTSW